jgi:carboxypeptidase Q
MQRMRFTFALALCIASVLQAQESLDTAAVRRIRDEAFERSQVMEIASWLTDVYGPRLTGSSTIKAAGDWTVKQLTEWGLANARMERFGRFGRGWENLRTVVHVTSPVPFPVIAYPAAWTPGTDRAVTGPAMLVRIDSAADFARYRGKLRGAIVLQGPPREVRPAFAPPGTRLTDQQLHQMAEGGAPARQQGPQNIDETRRRMAAQQSFTNERIRFLADEGVVAVLQSGRGDAGTVFVGGGGGSRDPATPPRLPIVVVAVEHHNRIARILAKDLPVTMEIDVRNRWLDDDLEGFNVLGEIPGTDKRDEVVMLGAHFDSWHSGTGATDNAAGSAVMLEAVRILKTLRLPLRRTVRIGLWGGEEQGLLGSRAYVRQTFGTADSAKPAHAKFSAYFNVDNGTGAIRGVYLQGNQNVSPIFEAWMKPFADKAVRTLTLRNTGGTDHLAFDAVGLPGFQFIQDPIEYDSRTHHSNMDVWDRLVPEDMKLNAAVVATFVYLTANRLEPLPRKTAALTP